MTAVPLVARLLKALCWGCSPRFGPAKGSIGRILKDMEREVFGVTLARLIGEPGIQRYSEDIGDNPGKLLALRAHNLSEYR